MKCIVRTNHFGEKRVVVLFDNKKSEAVSRRTYNSDDEAQTAIKWLKGYCGKKYSNHNLPKTWTTKGITRVLWNFNPIGEDCLL